MVEEAWCSKVSNDNGFRGEAVLSTQKLYLKRHGQQNWEVVVDFIQPLNVTSATPVDTYLVDVMRIHEDHKINWCNLHRKLPDSTGFYGYT